MTLKGVRGRVIVGEAEIKIKNKQKNKLGLNYLIYAN